MPALRVLSPGFQTTVQDRGRFGFAQVGLSPAGAADPVAFRLGHLLVGNDGTAASLEMTLVGGTFEFEARGVIAITGADCEPTLDHQPMPLWTSVPVRAGQTLQCRAMKDGARSYLSLRGGLIVSKVMGSRSTHLQSGIGGFDGRRLKKGDWLEIGGAADAEEKRRRTVRPEVKQYLAEKSILRVTAAPQTPQFPKGARDLFSRSVYTVSEASNRVGLRLKGPPIVREKPEELLTEGISVGAVQLPADGQPMILFVEHPTTGGYPKIANVLSADLCKVGQLRPHDPVRFEWIDFEAAIAALRIQTGAIGPDALQPEK
ncbi:MAG: biotin-dependent carboxyltransferase family protein [Nitrospirae bacterium]|nr:biotin-dependent carboxyltransferase family protein [Candidatus Manganitrophaceae bacterium]